MLQLDYTKIANWENVCYLPDPENPGKRVENRFNVAMGLMLMHTGMQSITYANAWQFYVRSQLVAACLGAPYTNGDGTLRYITPKDVADYIGLRSNCSSRTEAWFYKHLREDLILEPKSAFMRHMDEREREVRARVAETVAADPVLSRLVDGGGTVDPEEHGIIQE